MTTAVLTDGDGAGGGSSHPDVAEQKDFCFRHWQNAATSVGEGRCIQMSPGSEEERNNSASSRNHGETVWSQTTTSLLEEPPLASPILGSEQGWLDPGVASAARSGCSPVPAQLPLPLRPQLPEQLVSLAGCPTPEQDVSDVVCREGNDARCPGSCSVLALGWS